MRIIAQEAFNWTLLEAADGVYFSVLCDGPAMVQLVFRLTVGEADEVMRDLPRAATVFAEQVRGARGAYGPRHLDDFTRREDVRVAGLRWRKAQRQRADPG